MGGSSARATRIDRTTIAKTRSAERNTHARLPSLGRRVTCLWTCGAQISDAFAIALSRATAIARLRAGA